MSHHRVCSTWQVTLRVAYLQPARFIGSLNAFNFSIEFSIFVSQPAPAPAPCSNSMGRKNSCQEQRGSLLANTRGDSGKLQQRQRLYNTTTDSRAVTTTTTPEHPITSQGLAPSSTSSTYHSNAPQQQYHHTYNSPIPHPQRWRNAQRARKKTP